MFQWSFQVIDYKMKLVIYESILKGAYPQISHFKTVLSSFLQHECCDTKFIIALIQTYSKKLWYDYLQL